ncbi:hypothetical protein LEN26_021059 [Aphanomyces euteiches]|nr:hypothetical protein LEN26_021059 [Aphanomyces euteiches]KAH9106468.1 hypothetical protein AeMF1_017918 [Aphanomyces euteiches]
MQAEVDCAATTTSQCDPSVEDPGMPSSQFSRKTISVADDIILLNEIVFAKPWSAKRSDRVSVWNSIANRVNDTHGFGLKKPAKALRKRFDFLLEQTKKNDAASRRASGTTEEFEVRQQLLTDISTQIEDYNHCKELRSDLEEKKKQGLLNSGAVVRQLALNEIANHGNEDSDDESLISLDDKPFPKKLQDKGRRPEFEVKNHKARKVNAVMGAITSGLQTMAQSDLDLAKLYQDRLEVDREEARKNDERFRANQETLLAIMLELRDARRSHD